MNKQAQQFNERVASFKRARAAITSQQPTMSRDAAVRLVAIAEENLRSAIDRADYGAAELALLHVMLAKARLARIDYPLLYGPVEAFL